MASVVRVKQVVSPKCLVRLEHPNAQDANFFFPDVPTDIVTP